MSLLAAACLHAIVGLHTELKLSGNVQLRAGYSRSALTLGPESAPLLNTPLTQNATWTYNLILSPAADLQLNFAPVKLRLNYTPRVFLNALQPSVPPQVFHRAQIGAIAGQTRGWLLDAALQLTVGGLDLGQAGSLAGEFAGSLQPGSSLAASFINTSARGKVSRPIGRDWKFSTAETYQRFTTPNRGAATGQSATLSATDEALLAIQSLDRLESRNEMRYRLNAKHGLIFGLTGSYANFPIATYTGIAPAIGWEAKLNDLTTLSARVGAMRYWTQRFAGSFSHPASLAIVEFGVDHTFTDWHMPKLSAGLHLVEGPYYDLVLGQLTPRGTATGTLSYRFTHKLTLRGQLRDLTRVYWDGSGFVTVPPGQNINVLMASAQISWTAVSWLQLRAGVYGLDRAIMPIGTGPITEVREIYYFVGATGTLDLK